MDNKGLVLFKLPNIIFLMAIKARIALHVKSQSFKNT